MLPQHGTVSCIATANVRLQSMPFSPYAARWYMASSTGRAPFLFFSIPGGLPDDPCSRGPWQQYSRLLCGAALQRFFRQKQRAMEDTRQHLLLHGKAHPANVTGEISGLGSGCRQWMDELSACTDGISYSRRRSAAKRSGWPGRGESLSRLSYEDISAFPG